MKLLPFVFPGRITHSWYKALLLRLDPDDEEAEQKARMELERRTERELAKELQLIQGSLFDQEPTGAEVGQVQQAFQRVRDVLNRALQDSANLGVSVSVQQFENIRLAFDWTLAHEQARTWALTHTDNLLNQLGTTSTRFVGQAVNRWISNGEPLSALIHDLAPVFGRNRAALIASTEVTRAYAQGTLAGYAAAGYGEGRPTEEIPQHPRCRCWYSLRINKDNGAVFIFNTSADERVCPVCGPLHGQAVGVAKHGTGN